jgi:hypothetical protein
MLLGNEDLFQGSEILWGVVLLHPSLTLARSSGRAWCLPERDGLPVVLEEHEGPHRVAGVGGVLHVVGGE